jgi:putative nucleotidyltransferase with HDIG domain
MRLARSVSISYDDSPAGSTRTSFSPVHSASTPRLAISSIIVSTSRMRGTLRSVTGSSARSVAARIGKAPFLLPAARMRPLSAFRPSITNASGTAGATAMTGYPSGALAPTREQAWDTLTRYTKSESLLRHALAVEASTAFYARQYGEDEELWRVAALLHDFDYEMHPTLDKHPQDGAPILREEGYPEEVIETVLSHAEHLSLPRDTQLKKALFACDELSGFVHACALVRPTGLEGLEPKSVKKKLKQPSFAAGVHREDVYKGAEELDVDLDAHIRNVVEALKPIAPELGLPSPATA